VSLREEFISKSGSTGISTASSSSLSRASNSTTCEEKGEEHEKSQHVADLSPLSVHYNSQINNRYSSPPGGASLSDIHIEVFSDHLLAFEMRYMTVEANNLGYFL
jgi:hypothetical protein